MSNQEQGFEAHFHLLTPGYLKQPLEKFAAELSSAGYTTLTIAVDGY